MPSTSFSPYLPTYQNGAWDADPPSFADYIQKMREIMAQTYANLEGLAHEQVLAANSPQEYLPSAKAPSASARIGVLLLHGLFYTPYNLASLFQHFQAKEFKVRSLLLPGHGTVVGDLLDVNYHDWLAATRFAMASFQKEVDYLFVVGFSTGGLTALYHVLFGMSCTGLILIAPAFAIRNPFAWVSMLEKRWKKPLPQARWYTRTHENNPHKYLSCPFNAIAQVYELGHVVRDLLKTRTLKIPSYVIASWEDEVVSTPAILEFFAQHKNSLSQCLVFSHAPPSIAIKDKQIEVMRSRLPELQIRDFSHTCLPVAPDHPFFGQQGSFRDDLHYRSNCAQKLLKRNQHKPAVWGSIQWPTLLEEHLYRLSYNPHFHAMMQRVDDFIEKVIA